MAESKSKTKKNDISSRSISEDVRRFRNEFRKQWYAEKNEPGFIVTDDWKLRKQFFYEALAMKTRGENAENYRSFWEKWMSENRVDENNTKYSWEYLRKAYNKLLGTNITDESTLRRRSDTIFEFVFKKYNAEIMKQKEGLERFEASITAAQRRVVIHSRHYVLCSYKVEINTEKEKYRVLMRDVSVHLDSLNKSLITTEKIYSIDPITRKQDSFFDMVKGLKPIWPIIRNNGLKNEEKKIVGIYINLINQRIELRRPNYNEAQDIRIVEDEDNITFSFKRTDEEKGSRKQSVQISKAVSVRTSLDATEWQQIVFEFDKYKGNQRFFPNINVKGNYSKDELLDIHCKRHYWSKDVFVIYFNAFYNSQYTYEQIINNHWELLAPFFGEMGKVEYEHLYKAEESEKEENDGKHKEREYIPEFTLNEEARNDVHHSKDFTVFTLPFIFRESERYKYQDVPHPFNIEFNCIDEQFFKDEDEQWQKDINEVKELKELIDSKTVKKLSKDYSKKRDELVKYIDYGKAVMAIANAKKEGKELSEEERRAMAGSLYLNNNPLHEYTVADVATFGDRLKRYADEIIEKQQAVEELPRIEKELEEKRREETKKWSVSFKDVAVKKVGTKKVAISKNGITKKSSKTEKKTTKKTVVSSKKNSRTIKKPVAKKTTATKKGTATRKTTKKQAVKKVSVSNKKTTAKKQTQTKKVPVANKKTHTKKVSPKKQTTRATSKKKVVPVRATKKKS